MYQDEISCEGKVVSGMGVRALVDGCWAFSSTSDLSLLPQTIQWCIKAARHTGPKNSVLPSYSFSKDSVKCPVKIPVNDVDISEKIADITRFAHSMHMPQIRQVKIYYNESQWVKQIVNTAGCDIEEISSSVAVDFFSVAAKAGTVEMASDRLYRPGGYELIQNIDSMPAAVSHRAQALLSARACTQRQCPVILDAELTGVFVHEALGHGAEADIAQKGSFFRKKLNQRVAGEKVSVCDDPQMEGGTVYYVYDDEGVPSTKTMIVENGVFCGLLHSLESSVCGAQPTGNTRVDSYASNPVIRMSNTYMLSGDESLEEMVESVKEGIYLCKAFGAEADPTTGAFVFKAQEGQLIEKGRLTKPVKQVLLHGNIEEFLYCIEGVGREVEMSSGRCIKADQPLFIGSGGPPVQLSAMHVGGSHE